jgi:hypothetical protein
MNHELEGTMKIYRVLLFLLVAFALLFASTQAFASPADVPAKNTPAVTKTPKVKTDQATQKADEKATKQAEKADDKATKQADKDKDKHKNFKGTVSAYDASSISLTLKDGSSVTIALTPETRIKFAGKKGSNSTIEAGMSAMVQAIGDENGEYTARAVMVIPGKPVKVHRVGTVTEYTAGSSISIQDKDGNTFNFTLTAETRFLPAERAGELAVGSRVTLIAPRDPASGGVNVMGIVIHPAKP